MVRQIAALCLLGLVVLAGCVGIPTGTPGGTSSPATGTATTAGELAPPPGYGEAGIENATLALRTHEQALAGTDSYRIAITSETNETSSGETTIEKVVEGSTTYARMTSMMGGETQTTAIYETPDGRSLHVETPSESMNVFFDGDSRAKRTYAMYSGSDQAPRFMLALYVVWLTYGEPSTVTVDGQRLLEYPVTGVNESARSDRADDVRSASGSLRVDPDGRIRSVTLTIVREVSPDNVVRTRFEYSLTDVGTASAPRPSWLREVPRIDVSVLDGGQVVEVTNVGPGTLPAGTTVVAGDASAASLPTTETPLEPGESVFLYYREGDGGEPELALSASRPDPGAVAQPFSGQDGNLTVVVQAGSSRLAAVVVPLDAADAAVDAPV